MRGVMTAAALGMLAAGCAATGEDRPVMRALLERRSIRRYQQRPIPDAALREIVRAGTYAPSSNNRQGWRFIAVRDAAKVAAMNDILGLGPNEKTGADERPVAHIVVLIPPGGKGGTDVDAAAAVENILLAAHELGIGSCWRASFQPRKVSALLAVPPEWEAFAVVTLGYPAQEAVAVEADDTKVIGEDADRVEVHKNPLDTLMAVDGYTWKDAPTAARE